MENNWLENKTTDELINMRNLLEFQKKDTPRVKDYYMAIETINNQLNQIKKEIKKRDIRLNK